ncbi:MAG: DUF3995 domain-containing protein [Pseudomonadota bacterium]
MMFLANLVGAILMAVALLHLYWALGGLWPGKDEATLTRTVFGENDRTQMPDQNITAVVSGFIALAALWPLMWIGAYQPPLPGWLLGLGMIALTVIFLGRGAAGYVPMVVNQHAEQPFASLNARYYSPLIVAIGVIMFILLLGGRNIAAGP